MWKKYGLVVVLILMFDHLILDVLCIQCYKCRNMNGNNMECGDPLRIIGETYGKIERRDCPAYERCAKIIGSNSRGESYLIRDCYRTISFDAKLGSYKDHKITYYNDIIDGQIHFCNTNLCNRATSVRRPPGLTQLYKINLKPINVVLTIVLSLLAGFIVHLFLD